MSKKNHKQGRNRQGTLSLSVEPHSPTPPTLPAELLRFIQDEAPKLSYEEAIQVIGLINGFKKKRGDE